MANGKGAGADVGLLILRVALGGIFIAHGVQKLTTAGVKGFSDYLASLGLPSGDVLAIAAISAEIGGGALVALGILAPLGALALAVVMGVAIWKVHLQNGFWLLPAEMPKDGARPPLGWEYNAALLAMALCVLFSGAGKLSLLAGKKGKPGK